MLKKFMADKVFPQQEDGGHAYGLDPLRAAVIVLSVCRHYKIFMKDSECYHLCNALCLPQMTKEDFLNYWAVFLREVSFLTVYVLNFFYQNTVFMTIDYVLLCVFPAQIFNIALVCQNTWPF